MPQLGVIAFDRICLTLVVHRLVRSPPAQFAIRVEGITEVAFSVWGSVNDRLHHFRRPLFADRVRDDAARLPVNESDDECWLFLVPTKVNNSSISKVLTVLGIGSASLFARSFV